jgi:transcriptional regulator with XRE-family HTH domain
MSVVTPGRHAGELLRDWRQRRRLSQLDLAVEAEVSARHLSFVETGRATPSRELLTHLAEHLDVPLRERNTLLLAAGYAPVYRETPLDDESMARVRRAIDTILSGHEPFPALVFDRREDLVAANRPTLELLGEGVAPELLVPPVNTLRLALHPDGLAPRIRNLEEWAEHLLDRLDRELAVSGDPVLAALREEVAGYPGVPATSRHLDTADRLFVPLRIDVAGTELALFSTVATFGTARDVTLEELAIETFFPADDATEAFLRDGLGS